MRAFGLDLSLARVCVATTDFRLLSRLFAANLVAIAAIPVTGVERATDLLLLLQLRPLVGPEQLRCTPERKEGRKGRAGAGFTRTNTHSNGREGGW